MTKSYALTFWVVLSAASILSANDSKTISDQPSEAEQRLKQCLEWLPPGTETIIAAQGPFQIRTIGPEKVRRTLTEQLESWALGGLHGVREGKYLKALEGQTVLLSLEGSKHFRSPFGLGLSPYDGCHILIFDDKFTDAGDKLMQSMKEKRSGANRIHKHEQHEIFAFDEDWEDDRWTIFVARPTPNVLLVGTNRQFVTTVLYLMGAPKRQPELPKLSELVEWQHVDTKARFWAIRHFDPGNASNDPTTPLTLYRRGANNPDLQAIGLTFSFDPSQESQAAVVRYLSKNNDRQTVLKRRWQLGTLTDEGDDITKISILVSDGVAFPNFDLLLLSALGHAVFI